MAVVVQNSYLKEVVHYNSPISNIGLDDIKKCSAIQPQQLAQTFGPHCEELWSITKHANLTTEITSFRLTNNLRHPHLCQ